MFSHKLDLIRISSDLSAKMNALPSDTKWESRRKVVKEFKKTLKKKFKKNQNNTCAYCELPFDIDYPELDHIAPKSLYSDETFNTQNLVNACHRCNGFYHKGYIDTVDNSNGSYNNWDFNIVHPYFDDPQDYYEYSESDNSTFRIKVKAGLSPQMDKKAQNTLDIFALNKKGMPKKRKQEYLYKKNPIIEEISTYKKE